MQIPCLALYLPKTYCEGLGQFIVDLIANVCKDGRFDAALKQAEAAITTKIRQKNKLLAEENVRAMFGLNAQANEIGIGSIKVEDVALALLDKSEGNAPVQKRKKKGQFSIIPSRQ